MTKNRAKEYKDSIEEFGINAIEDDLIDDETTVREYVKKVEEKNNRVMKDFDEMKDDWRTYLEYWKSYPDKFLDFISPPNSRISPFFYQRVMIRAFFRYRKVFVTGSRGLSKSYTGILAIYLRCIFFPNSKFFIVAPQKEQAANISQEKIEEIWSHYPILKREVKRHSFTRDSTKLVFPNGSQFDVVQARDSSRGGRRHGGLIDEIADKKLDGDTLNEVVIPLMANNRVAANGKIDKEHEVHKSEAYVTTAGSKQSFAYEKMREILYEMVLTDNAVMLGSDYMLPVHHDHLDLDFINEKKESTTYNPLSFSREYESIWTGSSEKSLVSIDDFLDCRKLEKYEDKRVDKDAQYILIYDVARSEKKKTADSALVVLKAKPRPDGTYTKHVVNIYSLEGKHFSEQASFLKRKMNEFNGNMLIVDANGLGTGLIDILITEHDENPPYSVVNDPEYNKYKQPNSVPLLYAFKSSNKETRESDIVNNFMNVISHKDVKLLISESQARSNMKSTKKSNEKIMEELAPYIMTDILEEEVMNLEYHQSAQNTSAKQISKTINKDKFSAFAYGLFYVKMLEDKNKQKKKSKVDVSNYMMMKAPKSRRL